MRRWFLALAALNLVIVGWATWDEVVRRRPWKATQAAWNRALARRGLPPEPIAIRELTVPALDLHDRCTSCHLGLDRALEPPSEGAPGAARDAAPEVPSAPLPPELRAHPRHAELLGPHPPERFGCTPCHQGQGMQTKGVGRARFDHGRDDPAWERPLLAGELAQATCLDCHEEPPAGAELLASGRRLFEAQRCHACHAMPGLSPGRGLPGPPLDRLRDKTSQAFVEAWLRDARAIRPDTQMPDPWPAPDGPADGAPDPDAALHFARSPAPEDPGPRSTTARRDAPAAAATPSPSRSPTDARHQRWRRDRVEEPAALAAFLASLPAPAPLPADPSLPARLDDPPLIAAGRGLFDRVGCRGCHTLGALDAAASAGRGRAPSLEERFGPTLDAVGEKASARWLAAWLRRPSAVSPGAHMPDPRLDPGQIAPLVAFLVSLRRPGQPPVEPAWTPAAALDAAQVERGRRAAGRLGCGGCHEIPGLPREGSPGPDLDELGDRPPDELSFGDAPFDCGATPALACFTYAKLRAPRRFEGRAAPSLAMPDHHLDAAEARALTVFVLSARRRAIPASYRRALDPRARAIAAGERLFDSRNCRGYYAIAREAGPTAGGEGSLVAVGGAIRRFYAEPGLAPPPLTFAGRKFQYPWLWGFLRRPVTVRPFLAARMPDFALSDAEVDVIAAALAARDGEAYPVQQLAVPPLAPPDRAEAEALYARLQCRQCHPASASEGTAGRSRAELAPDLALAPTRLKPAWLRAWLLDPQALQPDTRMPAFFAPLDEEHPEVRAAVPGLLGGSAARQIEALTALVMAPSPSLRAPVAPARASRSRR